ncbi:MAG: glycosyltransferase family 4 protein [Sphingomicrobium sp.]
MRILIVTEALVLGGAETFVLRLVRRLRQDGHEAELLCLNPDLEDQRLTNQFPDVPIHRVPSAGLRTSKRADRVAGWVGIDLGLQQGRAARWIERHLRERFDVYHTNLFGADHLFARLKRRNPGMKIVSTLHGDYALYQERAEGTEGSRVLHWKSRLKETLDAVDHWVTISPDQQDQFAGLFGVDPNKLTDIPNGYAPPASVGSPAPRQGNEVRFIMVARGMREKGWGFLIDAFERVKGNASLTLVGEGAYLERLRSAHQSDRISFTGADPNPVQRMLGADVFVHPSIYKAESMPTVIVEALFAGLPIIATDVGSVPTMLAAPSGELAGTLLDKDESTLTNRLALAMQAYVDDPILRRRQADLAPLAFAKFDMGGCAAAYADLYARVVAESANSSSTRASH